MDGASRTFGTGPTIQLGGRTLTVNPKLLRCYGEIEAEIINRRGNPFDLARHAASAFADAPETALLVVSRAFEEAKSWRFVTITEIWKWIDETWAGRCFAVWLAVRDNDPDLTFDEVSRLYSDEYEQHMRKGGFQEAEDWADSIVSKIVQAEGDDELGNSNTSPPSGEGEKETTTTPESDESTGTTSSGS